MAVRTSAIVMKLDEVVTGIDHRSNLGHIMVNERRAGKDAES